jgi:putative oxygen-independent coproporphyrinogen III oxidase
MSREQAHHLRRHATDAERVLWRALSRRQLGVKFRRQEPLGRFVGDFVCFIPRLVVEVDGGQHADSKHDAARTAELESHGFRVLRFWNNDVLQNREGVLTRIVEVLGELGANVSRLTDPPHPDSLPRGEREQPTPHPGFGLYVHWPFCKAKCPYCDFNSHVRDSVDQGRWRAALLAELEHHARQAGRRRLTSIFFGGGTPSLMPPATVAALVERAGQLFELDPAIEITLEANPTSAEAGAFAGFAAAGVNRLSLGVQALDDASLAFLGRQHSAAEALAAVALARRAVPRLSFDLIYARPGQTPAAWAAELARALQEGTEHLSLYQLTLEENTVFHARARRGELALPPEATQAALYEATQETLGRLGLPAYEISNHARPGAESRHNLVYWRYGDYLGIGPGAHGRLTLPGDTPAGQKLALSQHRAPEVWLERVERDGHATRTRQVLGAEERLRECLLMGLRLAEGVPLARIAAESGRPLADWIAPGRLAAAQEAGYLTLDDARVAATAAGRQRLDALLRHLLA